MKHAKKQIDKYGKVYYIPEEAPHFAVYPLKRLRSFAVITNDNEYYEKSSPTEWSYERAIAELWAKEYFTF